MNNRMSRYTMNVCLCVSMLLLCSLGFTQNSAEENGQEQEFKPIFAEPVTVDEPEAKSSEQTTMNHILSGELLFINGYSNSDGWFSKDAVGFEYYGILSDSGGDIMMINLQIRFFFNSEFLEDNNPYKYQNFTTWDDYNKLLQFHNAWLRFKFLRGYLNVTLGHFDIPYGLEPSVDTHSSLIQKLVFYDLKMKKDWGIMFSGQADAFDYWLSATIGSGMGFHLEGEQYLFSFRIATPESESTFGFSIAYGKVLPVMGTILMTSVAKETLRLVADSSILISEFKLETEIMGGWQKDLKMIAAGSYQTTEWKPDFASLIHIYYIPSWGNNNLAFLIGKRLIWQDLTQSTKDLVLTLETNIRFTFLKDFKVELGYSPELYNSEQSLNWELNLLFHINLN